MAGEVYRLLCEMCIRDRFNSRQVKVVGRLIQKKNVWITKQCLRQKNFDLLASCKAVSYTHLSQGAYDEAYMDLIDSNHIQDIAKYYMEVHGLSQISYHYGVIDNMKTLYFRF